MNTWCWQHCLIRDLRISFSGAIERSAAKQVLEDKVKLLLQDNQSSEPLPKCPRTESVQAI